MSKNMLKVIAGMTMMGLSVASFASLDDCITDQFFMKQQITKYGSISTAGCPLNKYNEGIVAVNNLAWNDKDMNCNASCTYSSPTQLKLIVHCYWDGGNWGNTLTCGMVPMKK